MHDQPWNFSMQTMHWTIDRTSLDRYNTPVQRFLQNVTNIENPYDLNDTDVPTEESRRESQTQNTEETAYERAEEQRTQSNDNEHETHQLAGKQQ